MHLFYVCVCEIALFGQGPACGCCLLGLCCVCMARVYSGKHGKIIHLSLTHYHHNHCGSYGRGVLHLDWLPGNANNHKNETVVINPAHTANELLELLDPLRITLRPHTVTYGCQLFGLLCSQITSVPSNSSFQRLPSIDTVYNPEVSKHQAVYLRISYLDFLRNLWPSKHEA